MFISKNTTETHLSKTDFFRLARIFLRIFGNWPLEADGLPIRFYVNFISLFLAAFLGVAYGFVNLGDLNVALANFCGSMFELVSWCKALFVYMHRKELTLLLNLLYRYYNQEHSRKTIEIYRNVIKSTTVATIFLACGGLSTCSIYVFSPILKNLLNLITGQPIIREQPFKVVYPYIDQYSDNFFLACYIHLTHAGYCTAIVFNGIDSVFITACFHISAQFQIISNRIRSAFERTDPDMNDLPFTRIENERIHRSLIEIVAKQVKLVDVTDIFIEAYTSIILMHFVSVALIIGIGSINLILAPGSEKILYAVYIATVAIQSYSYAFSGNQIIESSNELCKALWDVNWHLLDINNRKMMLMMIRRCHRTKIVKVPFFELSLIAYSKIMSTAGSYITLLNNMLNE